MNAALRAQVIGPVLARLRSFLLRDFVKQSIGAAQSSFDMADILDGGAPAVPATERNPRVRRRHGCSGR